jgi:hypothetical protein
LDRKTRKEGKEKVKTMGKSEEEIANRHLEGRILQFEKLKAIAKERFKELPKDDTSPATAKALYALSRGLFEILMEIYEILAVIEKDMFAYDKEHLKTEKKLKALGKTVKKPEYKHVQRLLATLAKMERETRNRPIDNMMYRG